ncbi:hypothetical protein GCM10025734_58360 [Kitasatospora paranensis]
MFRRRQKSEDAVEQLAEDAISADEPADDVEGSAESENDIELDQADRVGLPPAPVRTVRGTSPSWSSRKRAGWTSAVC